MNSLQLPQQIGQYHILGQIGHGGMGTVFKALHLKLKRTVALKVITSQGAADPQAVERFAREMEAIGRLDHPHVVRAFDAGQASGTHFLVMEYLEGADLNRVVGGGRLSVSNACEALRQAAEGLQYIYDNGLVHRDLKPSNLFLTTNGRIKILDLGLAKLRNDLVSDTKLTASNHVIGTYDYVAPEQVLDSHAVDIRADIYSLGCTLYRLLSGKVVFASDKYETPYRKLHAHTSEPTLPIEELVPDLPAGLAELVNRMLCKSPVNRPQLPSEVSALLVPYCHGSHLASLFGEPTALLDNDIQREISSSRVASGSTATYDMARIQRPRQFSVARIAFACGLIILLLLAAIWVAPIVRNGLDFNVHPLENAAGLSELPDANERLSESPSSATSESATPMEPIKPPVPQPTSVPLATPEVSMDNQHLDASPVEVPWPGHRFTKTFRFDEADGSLEVNRQGLTLVRLGVLTAKPFKLSVTMEQSDWRGRAGIFFGYRELSERGAKVGEFQLLQLTHTLGKEVHPRLNLIRTKAKVLPASGTLWRYNETRSSEHPIFANQNTLAVEFDGRAITRISLNGKAFPELFAKHASELFSREYHEGVWGLYVEDCTVMFRKPTLEISE